MAFALFGDGEDLGYSGCVWLQRFLCLLTAFCPGIRLSDERASALEEDCILWSFALTRPDPETLRAHYCTAVLVPASAAGL